MPKPRKPKSSRETKNAREETARKRRLESEFESLRPEDFDVSVGNDGRRDKTYAAEKRQEFSRSDGEFYQLLRASGGDPRKMPKAEASRLAFFLAAKSEQERRFQNKRLARSIAIASANETLHLRMLMQLAQEYFTSKIRPAGYAKKVVKRNQSRTAIIVLSDLHFGSDLRAIDNPEAFGAEEESRRFASIVQQVSDYKSQYRNDQRLLVCANGDLIEGALGHDQRDGAPLTEQKGACLHYFQQAIAQWARDYPSVHIEWQPGNHGRDKLRHPGRATSSKWDGHEWWLGYCLAQMCKGLPNVTFSVPFRAVSSIKVYNHWFLQTHGDTEVRLGDPDTQASRNEKELAKVNSTRVFGHEYAVGIFGHFHKLRRFPWRSIEAIFNGCLVPPAGYARTSGYINERCGQVIMEATEDYPVGDLRNLYVGASEDRDAILNKIVSPFRFRESNPFSVL